MERQMDVVSVRLVKNAPLLSDKPITNPEAAVELLGKYMCELDREVLCVVNLRTDGIPINCNFVSVGAVNECMAHPREIMKSSILSNATSMIILHNHPSSSLQPSKEDTMVTDRMLKLGELMGIPLVDHIIVGGDNKSYFSFKEKDMLEFEHNRFETDYKKIEYQRYAVAEPSAIELQNSEDVSEQVTVPLRHRHR